MTNRLIKTAIIGLGHIAKVHIAALGQSPGYELAAVCDWQPELAGLAPESVAFYRNHQDMLKQGGFDAVIVATPNNTHNAMAVDVLRAGFDVIVEKPAGQTLEELDVLEALARRKGRHAYYAFHAARAMEVDWVAGHLQEHGHRYGPLTAFSSRFFDPYIDAQDHLVPHARSLGDCWSDSGVNALSVLDRFLPVDRLRLDATRQSGQPESPPGVRSRSVRFGFAVDEMDQAGLGMIDTAWDQGLNFKCTDLYFGRTGRRLTLDHSAQTVTEAGPDGQVAVLARFPGERLLNHYLGVFEDYRQRREKGGMNGAAARRIHERLFVGADWGIGGLGNWGIEGLRD